MELVILECFFEGREVGEAPTVGSMFILVHQTWHAVPAPRKEFIVDEPL
jgi:hypothetical protein